METTILLGHLQVLPRMSTTDNVQTLKDRDLFTLINAIISAQDTRKIWMDFY